MSVNKAEVLTIKGAYKTNTVIANKDITTAIIECLSNIGIKSLHDVTVKYILYSESPYPIANSQ